MADRARGPRGRPWTVPAAVSRVSRSRCAHGRFLRRDLGLVRWPKSEHGRISEVVGAGNRQDFSGGRYRIGNRGRPYRRRVGLPFERLRHRHLDDRAERLDAEAGRAGRGENRLGAFDVRWQDPRPDLRLRCPPCGPQLGLGHGLGPIGRRGHYVHDLEAASLQLFENLGKRERGGGLDVVQQQYAFAARLDAIDGAPRDFAVVDVGPIVGEKIHAPGHVVVVSEVLLDRSLAQQARNAEERSDRVGIPERGAQRGKAALDFLRGVFHGHLVEGEGMALSVIGDRVAFVVDPPNDRGITLSHAAHHEKGGLHAFRRQRLEDAGGVGWQRTVVEGEHHLVVFERQRFVVLHAADERVLAGVYHDGATDPERVGRTFLRTCGPGADQGGEQKICGNGAAHGPVLPRIWTNPEGTPRPKVSLALTLPKHYGEAI